MKIATQDLARLTASAAATAADNHPAPAGKMARLEASDGRLTVMATDFEYWLTMHCACEGDLAPIMVQASKLDAVVAKLSGDSIEVTLDGDALHIKAGRSKRKLVALPADSFPQLPAIEGEPLSIDAARAKECFAYCAPYTRQSGGQEYERGVRIEGNRFRATDGHTIAQIEYGSDITFPAATVPIAWIKAFDRIVPDAEVTLTVGEKAIATEWPEGRISGPYMSGGYPNTDNVTRNLGESAFSFEAGDLATAVTGVRALSDGRAAVGLSLDKDGIDVFARSQSGEAVDRIEAISDGPSVTIGFNADYLDRMAKGFGKVAIHLNAAGNKSPVIFTSDDAPDKLAVIVPMRL